MAEESIADRPTGFLSDLPSGNAEILMNQQPYDRSAYPQPAVPANQLEPVPENQSPWPQIIAIMAAAKGNFSPLFELSEQKRKTQVYNQLSGVLKETYRYINSGEVDKGVEHFQTSVARLGGRAPEISQFMAPEMQRLNEIQKNETDRKVNIKLMKNEAKLSLTEEGAKEFPNKVRIAHAKRLRDTASLLESIPYPMTAEHTKTFIEKRNASEIRYERGATVRSYSDEDVVNPLKEMPEKSDYSPFVMQSIQAKYGLSPDETINVLKGIPVLNDEGQNITPLVEGALRLNLAQLQASQRDIELQKMFPKPAEFNETLQQTLLKKYPKEETLRRMATGDISYNDYTDAQNQEAHLWFMRNAATTLAQNAYDVLAARRVGLNVLDKDTNAPSFGEEVFLSVDQVKASKGRFGYAGGEIRKNLYEALQAMTGLNYIDRVFENYGESGWASSAIVRDISSRIGYSLTPQTTASQLAEAIANDAIERVMNTTNASRAEIADAKRFVIGKFADDKTARPSRELLQGRLKEIIGKYMNTHITVEGEEIKQIEKSKEEMGVTKREWKPGIPEGYSPEILKKLQDQGIDTENRTPGGIIKVPRK